MPRSRGLLLSLLFAAVLFSPAPASASGFAQLWSLTGWEFVTEIGNTDGDPQREYFFASKVDGHLAIVDGLTGAIEREFTDFMKDNTGGTTQDVDGDGRLELFFWRPAAGPVTSLIQGYEWSGGNYVLLFSHTDPVESWYLVNVRGASTWDAIEQTANDVRVRDLTGAVLWQASAAIPGWSGNAPVAVPMDIDGDGVPELGVIENYFTPTTKAHYFNYSGGFVPAWTVSGWQVVGMCRTDGDPQPEVIAFHGSDGHYAIFDGLSGALEKEFPEFSFSDAASLTPIDIDGDGVEEILLKRPNSSATPLFTAYRWSAGIYNTMFSHTDVVDDFSLAHFRNTSTYDLLEQVRDPNPSEIRIRDLSGNVLFRASTQIAGWSIGESYAAEIDSDHDGLTELAIQNDATARFVRYSGSFVQSWFTTAWRIQTELSSTDADPQSELLVESAADHRFALMNPSDGAIEQEFPDFTTDDSYVYPIDTNGDGRLELLFTRYYFATQRSTGYDWNGSGYRHLYTHTEAMNGLGAGHLRNTAAIDLMEIGMNDLRVRDLSGLVLFHASSDLPSWNGSHPEMQPYDVNGDGLFDFFAIDDAAVRLVGWTGTTAVATTGGPGLQLLGSAPNPFRAGTTLRFSTGRAGNVEIRIFDVGGRQVRRLDVQRAAGPNEIRWDGRDDRGRAVPSGMLFYEVTANGVRQSGRMVRLDR